MSFSLSQCKVPNAKSDIRKSFRYIDKLSCATSAVKLGLKKYLETISKTRYKGVIKYDKFCGMVEELLEHCCDMPFVQIRYYDVTLNEYEIISHIRSAIISKNTNKLYTLADVKNLSSRRNDTRDIKVVKGHLSDEEAKKFFENLEVI